VPLFAITTMRGPRWESGAGPREQELWTAHAAFADGLVGRGVIVLGGPVEDPDERVVALIAVEATDEAAVHSVFAGDPWIAGGILELKEVRGWTVWLDGLGYRDRVRTEDP
jgi:uncharacterized protein YciI